MPKRKVDRKLHERMLHAAAVAILEGLSPPADLGERERWARRRSKHWKREHLARERRLIGARKEPANPSIWEFAGL